jgi:Secretion system C-terminal sorting domain/Cadherin-like/Proprotein convertase P-domain
LGKKANLFSNECSSVDSDMTLSFDDQSATVFNCGALNLGNTYKPTTPLSIFNNDEIKGDWKLKVTDNTAGNGGTLLGWTLKFCFAQTVAAPQLIVNDTLRVQKGGERYLDIKTLLAKTTKNNASEIKFTLVKNPENGILKKYGVGQNIGDTYTQNDLNNGKVMSYYNSNVAVSNYDYFLFVISDAEGGFLGTLRYNIIRDAKAPTIATKNTELEKMLSVFPNPSNQVFNVVLAGENLGKVEMNLFNIQGQKIANQSFVESSAISTEFDVQSLPNGIYYLEVNTSKGFTSKKIVVQH